MKPRGISPPRSLNGRISRRRSAASRRLCPSNPRSKEAIFHYRAALRLKPDFADALNELAWILATAPDSSLRSGAEAVPLAKRACELTQNRQAAFLTTLSAACAEAGQFPDAIVAAQRAAQLAQLAGQKQIAAQDEELLKLYQAGHPFRETH
jgi:tetratricopeptide (TPR) repeat protein